MSPIEIGLLGIFLIITTILLGVHVAFAMITIGTLGLTMIIGAEPALSSVVLIVFSKTNSYDFAVVPLFLLMSAFVSRGGIAKDAYDTACAWVGHFKGGLAMATSVACGFFAACCGSSLATAVAMGRMAYPEMKRHGYDSYLSAGTIAAGGTLGILIPPSVGFILIGILTQLSIGKLFIAGIIPGILQILFYLGLIYLKCRINPNLGPALARKSFTEKICSLKMTWPMLLLFFTIIGGIYGGLFTPTEAGAIGAFFALLIGLIRRQLNRSTLFECLLDTAKMSAMIMAMIIGAFIFNNFLAITRIPFTTSEYVIGLGLSRYTVLILILCGYLFLGTIFDVYAIIVLTVPIIYPTVVALGFDPIWYGVLMVRVVEIGMITPPFGINLFGLAGSIGTPMGTLYRGVTPFLIADLCHLILLFIFPALSTFLPNVMLGN